jgi:tetratricopeptide (TPR) repeat protein
MAMTRQEGFFAWTREHPLLTDLLCFFLTVLAAMFFRIVYVAEYTMTPLGLTALGPDIAEYDAWAKHLLVGASPDADVTFHAPLYPHVLAFLYRHLGTSLPLIRDVQLLADVLSLSLVWIAARRLWRRRVACIAGLIWIGYLPIIYYSAELLSEGLVILCLSAAFFLWSFLPRRQRLRPPLLVGVGLCLGLAATAHPLSLLFALAVIGLGPLILDETPTRRCYLTATCCLAAGVLAPVVIASWHQSQLAGKPVLIQDRSGMNLYIGNNPDADGTPNIPAGPRYQKLLDWPKREGVDPRDAQDFYRNRALEFMFRHPIRETGLLLRKFVLTWNAHEISSGTDYPAIRLTTHFMRRPFLPRFGWVAPFAIVGAWLVRRDRRAWLWMLLPVCYTLALTLFVTSGRYRLPMVPALIVLAALAIDRLVDAWHQRDEKTWRLATGIAVVSLLPVYMIHPPVPEDHEVRTALLMVEAGMRLHNYALVGEILPPLVAAAPNHVDVRHIHGLYLDATGHQEEALQELAAARALRPGDWQILANYAALLAETGRAAEARELLQAAADRKPGEARLWYELGVIDESTGNDPAAEENYRRAIDANPTLTSALLNLGILRYRHGDTAKAEELLRRAIRLDPRKANAHFALAVLLAERGQADASYLHFEPAVQYEPTNPTYWKVYEQVATDADEPERAAFVAKRAERALSPPAAETEPEPEPEPETP